VNLCRKAKKERQTNQTDRKEEESPFSPPSLSLPSMADNIEDIPLEGVHFAPNEAKMNELKEKANKLFAERKYEEALKEYSNALSYGENAIIHANRAFCWLKLDMYGAALTDAQKSIEMDHNYAKGERGMIVFCLCCGKGKGRERGREGEGEGEGEGVLGHGMLMGPACFDGLRILSAGGCLLQSRKIQRRFGGLPTSRSLGTQRY
jgi:tetratricopeptide (TPR) repeat protein